MAASKKNTTVPTPEETEVEKPRLHFDYSGQDKPGLLITYSAPPIKIDFLTVLLFLLGAGLTVTGFWFMFAGLFNGESFNASALILLIPGLVFMYRAECYRKNLLCPINIRLRVHVDEGFAEFHHNNDVVMLTLEKIGRLWISRTRTRDSRNIVEIFAYYNGTEKRIADISELSRHVGNSDTVVLSQIVDYLNKQRALPGNNKRRKAASEADKEERQQGYRPDFVTNTPIASRNIQAKELAPPFKRLVLSCGISLLMFHFYFSPYHLSTKALVQAIIGDYAIGGPLVVLIVLIVAPYAYFKVAENVNACSCRIDDAPALAWTLISGFAGLLLHLTFTYIVDETGFQFPDLLTVAAIFALMTWIVYRSLERCSCGAHPERNKKRNFSANKRRA